MKDESKTKQQLIEELADLRAMVAQLGETETAADSPGLDPMLFKYLIDHSNDAIFVIDPLTNLFLIVNERACEKLGYSRAELLKMGVKDIEVILPDDFSWKEHVNGVRSRSGMVLEGVHKCKDGTTFPVEVSVKFLSRDKDDYMVAIARDITERKQMERDLKKTAEQLRVSIDKMPLGYILWDYNFRVLDWNDAAERIFGYSKSEMLGKLAVNIIVPEKDRQKVAMVISNLQEGEIASYSEKDNNIRKDGTLISCQWYNTPLKDKNGKIIYVLSMAEDITERRRAEAARENLQAQLHHSQKMEAIGRLGGGIAHDFNNILTAIRNFSDLGMKGFKDSAPHAYDIFEHIRTASYRASNLTRQLLAFSNKESTKLDNLDMNNVINNLLKMLIRIIGEDVSIQTDLNSELWKSMVDSGKMEQVIMNLVVNARDAMPHGGTITIKTENITIDKEYCMKKSYARPGRFIRLIIEDTGEGIDEEHIEHIFEPYFTTKKNKTSSGLGLSVVYGIIEDHQGWINVLSEKGKGTTFKVYLPAVDTALEKGNEDKDVVRNLKGGGERILLVEDDAQVRKSTMMFLVDEGYVVLDVGNAIEALHICKAEEAKFHLVISDFILPDKDGLQLIEELRLFNPHLKAILTSGYMDRQVDLSKMEESGIRFLRKPFDIEEILETIKDVMRPV